MKVGIIIVSNRPHELSRYTKSLDKLGSLRDSIKLSVTIQPPFTGDEDFLSEFDSVIMDKPVNQKVEPVPFLRYRRLAMLGVEDCDYFWQMGDDHRMKDSQGSVYTKTFEEYYSDVFEFLDAKPEIGVVSCKGFLGGTASGYDFIEKFNESNINVIYTAQGGLFYKNIGVNNIITKEDTKLVGAGEESFIGFKILSEGYGFAKRFNSPMGLKHLNIADSEKRISYNNETKLANCYGYVRKNYGSPDWTTNGGKFPKDILHEIRKYERRHGIS